MKLAKLNVLIPESFQASLLQSGDTVSHVGNLTTVLIIDVNLINVLNLLQLGSTYLTGSNPSSPSSSPHSPSVLGSGSSEPVLNGGLCSAAHCSSAEGRCTPTETIPLWNGGHHWKERKIKLMCDAGHYYFIFGIICDFLFMYSLGRRNHFVLVTTPVLHTASKGVVTLVPGA